MILVKIIFTSWLLVEIQTDANVVGLKKIAGKLQVILFTKRCPIMPSKQFVCKKKKHSFCETWSTNKKKLSC
jgi:hypothetical protein